VRVIAFNTAEGWARDVTEGIAREIVDSSESLSAAARDFFERVSNLLPPILGWTNSPLRFATRLSWRACPKAYSS
jgi:hypothetical protein